MGIETLIFYHSSVVGEYCQNFISSNDSYKVMLRHAGRGHSSQLRMGSNTNLNNSNSFVNILTIRWKKISRKFIGIKIYEENTSNILLKKKVFKCIALEFHTSFIHSENIPLVYVIKIYTYGNLPESRHQVPELKVMESDAFNQIVEKDLEKLSVDFEYLLENKTFSDVLITDGENKMHVHKIVLSARSSVFTKMFQHPTTENQEGVIKITDIPFEVLRELMHYIYSGIVKIDCMHMARDLFIAADKYDIQNLKKICLLRLKSMSLDHVLENLLLANLYEEKELKDAAMKFIADNYSKVINLPNWGEFKILNQNLVIELLTFVLDKKDKV